MSVSPAIVEWPTDLTVRGCAPAERETVLRWDSAARQVVAWSARTADLRRLRRVGFVPRRIVRDARTGALQGIEAVFGLYGFRWGRKRRGTAPPLSTKATLAGGYRPERARDGS